MTQKKKQYSEFYVEIPGEGNRWTSGRILGHLPSMDEQEQETEIAIESVDSDETPELDFDS